MGWTPICRQPDSYLVLLLCYSSLACERLDSMVYTPFVVLQKYAPSTDNFRAIKDPLF